MEIKTKADEEFARVLRWHGERYPLMQPADWGKLTYQSCFGPEHLLGAADEQRICERLAAEWRNTENAEEAADGAAWRSEPLAGGLRRLLLPAAGAFDEQACRLLARLFCRTGAEYVPAAPEVVAERLAMLEDIPGMRDWLAAWEQAGRPAPSHSEAFRAAYRPCYRLLRWDWAVYFEALAAAARLLAAGGSGLVLIDGRCGGGKTSLAAQLAAVFGDELVRVVHIDDYYLPLPQRRPDWRQIPGENLDKTRFAQEVLQPLAAGGAIRSRAYDCRRGVLGSERTMAPAALTVIEGSYCMLLAQGVPADLRIYVECGREEQERRLRVREGEYFPAFERTWLPLEERYFAQYEVKKNCDLTVVTG